MSVSLACVPIRPQRTDLTRVGRQLGTVGTGVRITVPNVTVHRIPGGLVYARGKRFIGMRMGSMGHNVVTPPVRLPLYSLTRRSFNMFYGTHVMPLSRLCNNGVATTLSHRRPHSLFSMDLVLSCVGSFSRVGHNFVFYLLKDSHPVLRSLGPGFGSRHSTLAGRFRNVSSAPFACRRCRTAHHQLIRCVGSRLAPASGTFLLKFRSKAPS